MSPTPSRRQVLTAAAVLPLAACTKPEEPAPVDPDDALRDAAIARERQLIEAYDRRAGTGAASPADPALREEHVQHLTALGGTVLPSPEAQPPLLVKQTLIALEKRMAAGHAADALRASRSLAAVLASLAASEASHVVALA